MHCEKQLIKLCTLQNFVYIYQLADMYNANRLKEFCQWFLRINPDAKELLQVAEEDSQTVDYSNVS